MRDRTRRNPAAAAQPVGPSTGCWTPRSTVWSSAAGPAPRPPWSPIGPGSPAAPNCTTTAPSRRCCIAAVEHLAERRSAELRAEAAALPPDGDRLEATIDLLASLFTGPLFAAAIEVWVAARTDPALRSALVPVEARFGREVHRLTVELLGANESRPGVREAVQATLDLMRGLGVASLLTDDSARPYPPARRLDRLRLRGGLR